LTWLEDNFLDPFEGITTVNHHINGASQVNGYYLVVASRFVAGASVLENNSATIICNHFLSASEIWSENLRWRLHCILDEL